RAAAGRDGLRCGCGQRRAPEECSVCHRERAKLVVSRKEKTILREGEGSRCLAALFVFIEGTTQVGGDGDFIKSGGATFFLLAGSLSVEATPGQFPRHRVDDVDRAGLVKHNDRGSAPSHKNNAGILG